MEALTGKVSFRVDEDTESLLIKLADDRKITKSAMGRICLMDGVSGFDRKHEALVLSIQGLQHQMGELLSIGRISLSATLLLRDSKDDNIEVAKARLLEEYRNAVAVAKLIQVQLAQLA